MALPGFLWDSGVPDGVCRDLVHLPTLCREPCRELRRSPGHSPWQFKVCHKVSAGACYSLHPGEDKAAMNRRSPKAISAGAVAGGGTNVGDRGASFPDRFLSRRPGTAALQRDGYGPRGDHFCGSVPNRNPNRNRNRSSQEATVEGSITITITIRSGTAKHSAPPRRNAPGSRVARN